MTTQGPRGQRPGHLSALIRERMDKLGIRTNAEVARRIGRSETAVGHLLSGVQFQPRGATVRGLVEGLGIPEEAVRAAIARDVQERVAGDLPSSEGVITLDLDNMSATEILERAQMLIELARLRQQE